MNTRRVIRRAVVFAALLALFTARYGTSTTTMQGYAEADLLHVAPATMATAWRRRGFVSTEMRNP